MSGHEHEAQQDARSSIKATRNAKGEPQFEVKVRVGDTEAELDEARRIAVAQYRALTSELVGRTA
jgi:hypothetical protein